MLRRRVSVRAPVPVLAQVRAGAGAGAGVVGVIMGVVGGRAAWAGAPPVWATDLAGELDDDWVSTTDRMAIAATTRAATPTRLVRLPEVLLGLLGLMFFCSSVGSCGHRWLRTNGLERLPGPIFAIHQGK